MLLCLSTMLVCLSCVFYVNYIIMVYFIIVTANHKFIGKFVTNKDILSTKLSTKLNV